MSNSDWRLRVLTVAALSLFLSSHVFAQQGTWTTKAPMVPRSRLGAGVIGGALYAVGGFYLPSAGTLSTVQAYDPRTNTWTTKASLLTQRANMAVGVIDGIMYVAGGSVSCDTDRTVEAYDPRTNTWTTKAPIPTPRCAPVAGVIDGILYVVGEGSNPVVEAYDPKTNTWGSRTPIPTPRYGAAAGVIDGILYVVGGLGTGRELDAYDPKSNTWSIKAPMPTSRAYLSVGVVDGRLYAVGGGTGPFHNEVLSTVEVYDPRNDSWSAALPMPTARKELGVAVVDDVLYAFGGESPSGYLGANEGFDPFLRITIDIKPGDPDNTINLKSRGTLPVAILGSATFDPVTVDPATVTLAGAPAATRPNGVPMIPHGGTDFDGDGYLDLLLHFRTQDLQLTRASTEAVLYGQTFSGQRIRGADAVRIVPSDRLLRSNPWTEGLNGRRRLPTD